ncbi:uncharacterized protein LOC111831935 [Capsella rubella]|uniref:uncharacterized protein LOC111831935 n=1 Tax=Capsella rubella TaxID=81985 RepID=UPI000CD5847B|nr:uncharacterized protein LOC111831935 [Capsella rubella]
MRMRKWAIEWNFEYRTLWSDRTRLILGCLDVTCSWRLRAAKVKSSDFFVVKHYIHEHNCDTTCRHANHRQATANLLGSFLCSHYGEKKAGLKPKQILERVRMSYSVHINYKKAWRVKEAAELLVRGTPEDSYHNIAKWLFMTKEKNPGSVLYLDVDPLSNKFRYVFVAYGQSLRGFALMRRVIAVDGTFLKAKFKGTLLVATAQDGDYHLYPLAFAIVDSENDKSWSWFFRCLQTIIPDSADLVFVSDRAPSIANELLELYPAAHHGICRFHLGNIIKVKFRGQSYLPLVESAANAYTQLPVLSLLETIRLTLTEWFLQRRALAAKHNKRVTPKVVQTLVSRFSPAMKLDVFQVDEDEFEVKDDVNKFIVDLRKRQCSCCVFDIDKIPCIHAIAAAKRSGRDENEFVDDSHLNDTWFKAYSESVHPNGDVKDWTFPELITNFFCAPPGSKPSSGRPPKKRIRSKGEYGVPGSKSQSHKCSRCGQGGHNKSTCRNAICLLLVRFLWLKQQEDCVSPFFMY